AFQAFDAVALADGAVPRKYKELMALAVALTTQCPYCLEIHTRKAREARGTPAEIAPTLSDLAALRARAAPAHRPHHLQITPRARAPHPAPSPSPCRPRSPPARRRGPSGPPSRTPPRTPPRPSASRIGWRSKATPRTWPAPSSCACSAGPPACPPRTRAGPT